ncbi:Cell wall-associated hydrolase, NlpC family [Flexibacter flexilis DSM 6793]|uniref:Cell wall-associated hydrolase, NlpC family n=1 Tax=Flexibacter flexilis DSM 6793 TaxID=927664 RepID=A0A1I1DUH4_9BACT|nr:C40 family peptidase [Flexibacter flexilis]SFB78457.1 Cell wall-associated hydrolase, NlpC family [Flexibacter flexilis DSM 6793]
MRNITKLLYFLMLTALLLDLSACRSKKRALRRKAKLKTTTTTTKTTNQNSSSNAQFLTKKEIESVIKAAKSYLGTPYKYGGTTRLGMDCSGLMHTSFKAINKSVPRRAQDQSTMGKEVKIKEIEIGDWVFFTDTRLGKGITHVGIVTEIKDIRSQIKFIHSSTKLGVVENNLYSEYYIKTFVKAVRPCI